MSNLIFSAVHRIGITLKRWRIRACWHRPPWNCLASSKTIWWRAPISLEFYRGETPPPKDNFSWENGYLFGFWTNARIIQCRKCGGILNEIMLGEMWLEKLKTSRRKFLYPDEVDELERLCGWDKHLK